jgi:hypothetical protein
MHRLLVCVVMLLLSGCASGRPPAPGAAAATVGPAGEIEIVARPDAWRGWPAGLARFVTPIHVTIVNRGPEPVRVSHDDFELIAADGQRLASVLPAEVRGVVHEPPPPPRSSMGLVLGPEGDGYERDWVQPGSAWNARADPAARVGESFALPSPDVLDLALREGVLEPDETASGFAYFERRSRVGPAELTARLVSARTGQTLGRAVLPLTLP